MKVGEQTSLFVFTGPKKSSSAFTASSRGGSCVWRVFVA